MISLTGIFMRHRIDDVPTASRAGILLVINSRPFALVASFPRLTPRECICGTPHQRVHTARRHSTIARYVCTFSDGTSFPFIPRCCTSDHNLMPSFLFAPFPRYIFAGIIRKSSAVCEGKKIHSARRTMSRCLLGR